MCSFTMEKLSTFFLVSKLNIPPPHYNSYQITPRFHNGDPEYYLVAEQQNLVWKNLQQILVKVK